MSEWDRTRSLERISRLRRSVPRGSVTVREFGKAFADERRKRIVEAKARSPSFSEDLIFDVKPSEAVLVDGVHVYVHLVDFHEQILDASNETEEGHRRLLQTLHVHYTACDAIAEEFEAQRVDYHGARMHAVIVTPADDEAGRLERAFRFADALKRTIEEIGETLSRGRYRTRVRIGIDSGPAVAINGGRGNEPEPLFLGSPANYAAKLAEGEEPGIYPSSRVRRSLNAPLHRADLATERANALPAWAAGASVGGRRLFASAESVETATLRVRTDLAEGANVPYFAFHRHEPPLRGIDFRSLSPSNAVRMELMSVFGDLDGFTAYVDACIASGGIGDMVASLHVIRGELAATLRDDAGGRKVRFIGDCIHGVIAEGTRHDTDADSSIRSAVAAAAGMRSSFELCREVLPGLDHLDIAIGLEFGSAPICRVGLRGERSVRCCVGKAVSASEALQRSCDETLAARRRSRALTRIGPRAERSASPQIRRIFDEEGVAAGLDYASFVEHTRPPALVRSGASVREARPYAARSSPT